MTNEHNKPESEDKSADPSSKPASGQVSETGAKAQSTGRARKQEKRKEADRAASAGSQTASSTAQAARGTVPPPAGGSTSASVSNKKSARGTPRWLGGLIVLALVAGGFLLWWQQAQLDDVSRQVATRLQDSESQLADLSRAVEEADANARSQTDRIAVLRREVRTLRSEVASYDKAWQSASRGVDDRILINDVRRLLTMAQQQLMLAGHVTNAISILEAAHNFLESQHDSAAFGDLIDAIDRDIDRLRALPQVNVNALSIRLEQLSKLTQSAPLLMPDHAVPTTHDVRPDSSSSSTQNAPTGVAGSDASEESAWWKRWMNQSLAWTAEASRTITGEFSNLVEVHRVDEPIALLLSDQQALLLRTNLRSMVLTAQLAMLTREPSVWEAELGSIANILETFYDGDSPETREALNLVRELRTAKVRVETGSISDSLGVLALTSQSLRASMVGGESN